MEVTNSSDTKIVNPIKSSSKMPLIPLIVVIIILFGLGVGWLVSSKKNASTQKAVKSATVTVSNTEAGVSDPNTIKDVTTATGVLQTGGIDGEGTFHLDRPGGISQTVYLTSTIVDMSAYVGKKVQIWGQTQASQHAGWFMDVGKIKVVQ